MGRDEIRLGYAERMRDICVTAASCLPNLNINIHQHLHSSNAHSIHHYGKQIRLLKKAFVTCLVTHACGVFGHFNYRKNSCLRILTSRVVWGKNKREPNTN